MIAGRVIGRIWATKRIDQLPQGALLEVETDGGGRLVAFDPLGCGEGERVVISQGSTAAGYFDDIKAQVDALIISSIDEK